MNIEEIKVGDGIKFENRHGKVCKLDGERALCRFYGYTMWVPTKELVKKEWKYEEKDKTK